MKTKFFLFLCAGVIAASAEETVRKYDFNRNCEGWYTPSYWNGKLTHSAEAKSGGGSAKLEATEAKGHTFGRMVSQNLTKMPLAGKKFKISYQAKGSGTLFAGMLCATANSSGRLDYRYLFPETPLTLTKEWRKGEAVIDLQKTAPQTLSLLFELRGEGKALIDEIRLIDVADASISITPQTPHQVIRAGDSVPQLRFLCSKPNMPCSILVSCDKQKTALYPVTGNADGTILWQGSAAGAGLTRITAAANGTTGEIFVSVLPPAEYASLDALAKNVKTDKTVRILWLGDSLCDFDRSFNAVDKLSFWLNKYNPGKFILENRAVRGDYILRVEERLLGKKCFSPDAYQKMWGKQYDLILIQLGNNDCMATTNSKFATPLVPTDAVAHAYSRVMKLIRQHSDAKIVLTSATYPDVPLMKRNGERALGKYFFARFGMEEFVLPFNNAVKTFAAENKADFIDLHTPMKQSYDKKNYVDGIHLSESGHTLMAKILLAYFAAAK